ncbi:MAG: amidohydrolase family protein [Pseudomonadales bacterium]|nr:amidohydrolase family protein [Pseudomonadales bacterium]
MQKFLFFVCALLVSANSSGLDLVIKNGRVMDPASGLDGIRHIGIEAGRIVAVSETRLSAPTEIDAKGLVVAPGFIDLHAHGQDPRSNLFQVQDGVTTAIEGEIGVLPVDKWLASREGKSRPNYGATAGHLAARIELLLGREVGNPIFLDADIRNDTTVDYANTKLEGTDVDRLVALLDAGVTNGGLGIGIGATYTPGASHEELFRLFKLAAKKDVPIFVHIRQARYMGGDLLAPLQEMLANAAATGASLHVVHINSSLDRQVRTGMEMIRGAVAQGHDVTTEAYPYTAGSTRIESALFDDYEGDLSQLQWTLTGERLTQETFAEFRKIGGWVILHGRDEETNTWITAQPDVMVASDGVPFIGDASHPRGAGTFARVLGHYARDLGALELMAAIRKMTIDPARRIEQSAASMKRKGRVSVGADADIVVFSAEDILDQATYSLPARPSMGIVHVLVNGEFVVRDGELKEDAFPGRPIRSEKK